MSNDDSNGPVREFTCDQEIHVLYKNYRGEIRERWLLVLSEWYGSTEWHPEPQRLLKAVDLGDENHPVKDFAVSGILAVGCEEIANYKYT